MAESAAKLHASMRSHASSPVGDVGRHVPALSSALRPNPVQELEVWGGEKLVRGKRVLDLGCGDGRFAIAVAPYASSVDGLDPDAEAITAAKKTARKARIRNAHFAVRAAQHLSYADMSFDVVILSWTL